MQETRVDDVGRVRDAEVGPNGEVDVLFEVLRPEPPKERLGDGSHIIKITPVAPTVIPESQRLRRSRQSLDAVIPTHAPM